MADLRVLADQVLDELSFLAFLQALAADWEDERKNKKESSLPSAPHGPGANGWENGTIGSFLESAVSWAEASQGGTAFYKPPSNPWRRCAHILLMGKFYE